METTTNPHNGILTTFSLLSCRNLPGVEVSSVERLNLLQLAPGGHMGRFVIFTKSAFDSLDKIFGKGGVSDDGECRTSSNNISTAAPFFDSLAKIFK